MKDLSTKWSWIHTHQKLTNTWLIMYCVGLWHNKCLDLFTLNNRCYNRDIQLFWVLKYHSQPYSAGRGSNDDDGNGMEMLRIFLWRAGQTSNSWTTITKHKTSWISCWISIDINKIIHWWDLCHPLYFIFLKYTLFGGLRTFLGGNLLPVDV